MSRSVVHVHRTDLRAGFRGNRRIFRAFSRTLREPSSIRGSVACGILRIQLRDAIPVVGTVSYRG